MLWDKAATVDEPLLGKRLQELEKVLTLDPIDRPRANVSLRQVFDSVVIGIRPATLCLGGSTAAKRPSTLLGRRMGPISRRSQSPQGQRWPRQHKIRVQVRRQEEHSTFTIADLLFLMVPVILIRNGQTR